MIREWHDQPSASALESAGCESAGCCFISLRKERSGVSMTKKLNSNQRWVTSHVSADAADTVSFDGLKVRSPQGSDGWCFACNEGAWRKLRVFSQAACILNWRDQREGSKQALCTGIAFVLCLLSCVCLQLSPKQVFSHAFSYICVYLFSQTACVSLLLSLRVHTMPLFLALASLAQNLRAGSLVVLWECYTHTHTHTHTYTHIYTHAGLIDFSLPVEV